SYHLPGNTPEINALHLLIGPPPLITPRPVSLIAGPPPDLTRVVYAKSVHSPTSVPVLRARQDSPRCSPLRSVREPGCSQRRSPGYISKGPRSARGRTSPSAGSFVCVSVVSVSARRSSDLLR